MEVLDIENAEFFTNGKSTTEMTSLQGIYYLYRLSFSRCPNSLPSEMDHRR